MKKRIAMIAGWAHPGDSLAPVAQHLGDGFEVSLHAATNGFAPKARSIVLGWSLGGMRAMEFAAGHPELVSGLVLIATTPRFTVGPGSEFGTPDANLLEMMRQLKEDAKATFQGFIAFAALPHRPSKRELVERLESLQEGLRYLRETDLKSQVSRLKSPTLILHGRQDVVIPHAAGEWLAEHLPHSKLVSADNMGHDLPLRRPAWVAREIRAFFQ